MIQKKNLKKQKKNPKNKILYIIIMDRSEYYYEVVNDNYLNKQFDCNPRTPYTRYYFDLDSKTGYAQGLYSNIKVYQ